VEVPEAHGAGGDLEERYENNERNKIIEHLKADLKITRVVNLNHNHIFNMMHSHGNNVED